MSDSDSFFLTNEYNRYLGSTQNLPNAQRRGAIIVLGMVALAKRSVVTDHVDTILKVGFGRLGKVSAQLRCSLPRMPTLLFS